MMKKSEQSVDSLLSRLFCFDYIWLDPESDATGFAAYYPDPVDKQRIRHTPRRSPDFSCKG